MKKLVGLFLLAFAIILIFSINFALGREGTKVGQKCDWLTMKIEESKWTWEEAHKHCGGECVACAATAPTAPRDFICKYIASGKDGITQEGDRKFANDGKNIIKDCQEGWFCDGQGECTTNECHIKEVYWADKNGNKIPANTQVEEKTNLKMVVKTKKCKEGDQIDITFNKIITTASNHLLPSGEGIAEDTTIAEIINPANEQEKLIFKAKIHEIANSEKTSYEIIVLKCEVKEVTIKAKPPVTMPAEKKCPEELADVELEADAPGCKDDTVVDTWIIELKPGEIIEEDEEIKNALSYNKPQVRAGKAKTTLPKLNTQGILGIIGLARVPGGDKKKSNELHVCVSKECNPKNEAPNNCKTCVFSWNANPFSKRFALRGGGWSLKPDIYDKKQCRYCGDCQYIDVNGKKRIDYGPTLAKPGTQCVDSDNTLGTCNNNGNCVKSAGPCKYGDSNSICINAYSKYVYICDANGRWTMTKETTEKKCKDNLIKGPFSTSRTDGATNLIGGFDAGFDLRNLLFSSEIILSSKIQGPDAIFYFGGLGVSSPAALIQGQKFVIIRSFYGGVILRPLSLGAASQFAVGDNLPKCVIGETTVI